MNAEDPHHHHRQRLLHFARIRRVKWILRFMPRRARFHTYPLVGRFAGFARARSYLWTFSYPQIRPAFYLGSVLTLLPVVAQLPIAFGLCLLFRTNFMILGGLQFASNLLTLPFIFAGCYQIGMFVLRATGLEHFADKIPLSVAADTALVEPSLTQKIMLYGSALTLGALIAGLALGAALDLLWKRLVLPAARLRAARKPITAVVTPHDNAPPSPPAA
jgi:uncharacterized protein (DUF2062 family)